jgi:hypothetical protein
LELCNIEFMASFCITAAHHKAPGSSWWELEPDAATAILLRDAPELAQLLPPYRLNLEWQKDSVAVAIERQGSASRVAARAALVHESMPELYSVLALPAPSVESQRLWRWIFRIARVPLLRRLLALAGSRARA